LPAVIPAEAIRKACTIKILLILPGTMPTALRGPISLVFSIL